MNKFKENAVAVLFADIFEYSKHTETREIETHTNLKIQLENACELVTKNSGQLARSHGDSIIAIFSNPSDAVYCAVEIHASSNRINFKIRDEEQLKFRIGISYGKIIDDINGEPYGNNVNIAARLENLANPGDILISEDVCDQLDKSIPFFCYYYGNARLNNIEKEIKIFKVIQQKPISDRWYDLKNKTIQLETTKAKLLFTTSTILTALSIAVLFITILFLGIYNDNYMVVRIEPPPVEGKVVDEDLKQKTDLNLYKYLISVADQSILEEDYGRAEEYLNKAVAMFPERPEALIKKIELLEIKNKHFVEYDKINYLK